MAWQDKCKDGRAVGEESVDMVGCIISMREDFIGRYDDSLKLNSDTHRRVSISGYCLWGGGIYEGTA